jgi:hypothetical protein
MEDISQKLKNIFSLQRIILKFLAAKTTTNIYYVMNPS